MPLAEDRNQLDLNQDPEFEVTQKTHTRNVFLQQTILPGKFYLHVKEKTYDTKQALFVICFSDPLEAEQLCWMDF